MKDIFLCHTGSDKEWVRELGERLEQHQVNGRSLQVFLDEWDIDYGENLLSKLDAGLKQSRFLGLIISPRMLKADWPTAEWQSQVMADPAGKKGRILPLLRHKVDPETGEVIELPFVLSPLKRFDFTRDRDFERELAQLVRRLSGLPPSRGSSRGVLGSRTGAIPGGQEAADHVDEALASNLFSVTAMPRALSSVETSARKKSEVWSALTGYRVPSFVLHGERLVSFVPLNATDYPFAGVVTRGGSRSEPTEEWMRDPDKQRQLVGILNGSLREHCYPLGIRSNKKKRSLFYCPLFEGRPSRAFQWSGGNGAPGRARQLAKMKERPDGTKFGVHMSAEMRFISIGERLFLIVEPGWLFTSDGVTPLEGKEVGRFSTMWGGKERNAAVLRNVLMWGLLIAGGKRELLLNLATEKTPEYATIGSVPAHTMISRGIAGDSIRLDRILGGEGAGEVAIASVDGAESERGELDEVADLALLEGLEPPALKSDGIDLMGDQVPEGSDDEEEMSAKEGELPF